MTIGSPNGSGIRLDPVDTVVTRYIAAWNETDPNRRADIVREVFTDDARYCDPLTSAAGHAEIGAMIGAVQQQFPGMVFTLAGPVDAHHDQARFGWALGVPGEPPAALGFDVVESDQSGRFTSVLGFLDPVPTGVKGYGLAILRDVHMGAEIQEYLERIDATLAAHGGRFLVHGSKATAVEGDLEGDAIVVEFPSPAALRAWYRSPEYQAILPLRSENSDGTVVLLDGAGEYHRATDILA